MLSEKDILEALSQPELKKIINDSVEDCKKSQQIILDLIEQTEEIKK